VAVADPGTVVHRSRSGTGFTSALAGQPKVGVVGLSLAGVVTVVAVAAPVLAPHDPLASIGPSFQSPSSAAWFGTDELGRDMFSRVLYGIRATWFSALVVIAVAVVIGGLVGLVAGAFGGWVDNVLMRVTDTFLALPGALIAIAVVAAMGPGLRNTLVAVSIFWWPLYARIVRGEVRALVVRPHVDAARVAGAGHLRVMARHLAPGVRAPLLVAATLDVGALVLILSGLSFLGLGAPPPSPELGAMAARGQEFLLDFWWVAVVPGVAVFLLALAANLAGDGLRDMVDE